MNSLSFLPESLLQFALGNLAVAVPLGLFAWWLQHRGNRPFLTHVIWLFVLIKLVTPPIYSLRFSALPAVPEAGPAEPYSPGLFEAAASLPEPTWFETLDWQLAAVVIWFAGSAFVLSWTLFQAFRFNRLLGQTSRTAGRSLQESATRIANRLGLACLPEIHTTAANISPMVWWIGGPVRIYLPQTMVERMNPNELRSILSHELGHVTRRDHWVRWLECLVCVALWWNPVAWWARRNLRVCEEICCDAFVLARTDASRDSYASALVSAMECLQAPTLRPSGMASHVNGGFIERRIKMILSGKLLTETPRWLRGAVIAAAVLILPLGFTLAQNAGDLERVEQWLESGVNSAFLTEEQAEIMLNALRGAGRGEITRLETDDGRVVVVRRQVMVDGEEVLLTEDFRPAEFANGLAFAQEYFARKAATGEISEAEARRIAEDMNRAFETGLETGTADAFYEQQFEIGLISLEEAERLKLEIAEMEAAWNQVRADEDRLVENRNIEVKTERMLFELDPVETVTLEGNVEIEVIEAE